MDSNADIINVLNNMVAFVQRAGPVFNGQATLQPDGEGYRATMRFTPHPFNNNELGARVRKDLGKLIAAYMRQCGWRVKAATCKKGYFELAVAASKARSSSSQKPNASL